MRTTMWSRLRELDRYQWAVRFGGPLESSGMTVDEFDRLWQKAQRSAARAESRKPGSSPEGILAKICKGPWRAELDAEDEKERHAAARARGSATGRVERRDGPYGLPAPASAADVVDDVLGGLRRSHG